MSYILTHGSGPGPAPIDTGNPRDFDLDGALAHAHELLAAGTENVAITDGAGHSISGNDLIACCNGDMTLTTDLRAIPN